jgi:hypothetical protein
MNLKQSAVHDSWSLQKSAAVNSVLLTLVVYAEESYIVKSVMANPPGPPPPSRGPIQQPQLSFAPLRWGPYLWIILLS